MNTNIKPVVYLLSDGGHDYSGALEFGDIIKVDIPIEAKWDISQLHSIIEPIISDAHDTDMLIVGGSITSCCIATAILVEMYGKVNYLIFQHGKYKLHTLYTGGLPTV